MVDDEITTLQAMQNLTKKHNKSQKEKGKLERDKDSARGKGPSCRRNDEQRLSRLSSAIFFGSRNSKKEKKKS